MRHKSIMAASLVFVALLAFGAINPAHAWYMELTNVDGTLTGSGQYTMDIYYEGEPSDILNVMSVNVQYDTYKLAYAGILFTDWYDGFDPIWSGDLGVDTNTPGQIRAISASEDFSNTNRYQPMGTAQRAPTGSAETPANHIATLYFDQMDTGDFTALATFAFTGDAAFPTVITKDTLSLFDDSTLYVSKIGTSSALGPDPILSVPIGGAIWLLGSGLTLLLGVRRWKYQFGP